MPIEQLTESIQYPVDVIAIFACALTGAFLAVRKDFDLFGTAVMAESVSLGGAVLRDLVIGVRPVAFTDPGYYLAPLLAAALVFFSANIQRWEAVCDVADAAALGLFSVGGTIKALAHGLDPLPAGALGVACGVGGGVIAGVMAREIPSVLRWNQDLYAVPSVAGAGTVGVLHHYGLLNVPTALSAAALTFVLRVLAVRFHWRTPRSRTWRNLLVGLRQQVTPSSHAEETVRLQPGDVLPAKGRDPRAGDAHEDTVRLRMPRSTMRIRVPGPRRTGSHPTASSPSPAVPDPRRPIPDPRLPSNGTPAADRRRNGA